MHGNPDKARTGLIRNKWIFYSIGILFLVLGMKWVEHDTLRAFSLVIAGCFMGMALIYAGGARVINILLAVIDKERLLHYLHASPERSSPSHSDQAEHTSH